MLKGKQIAEILFYKHRSIVSKTERPFQSKLGAAYSAPAGDVIFPQRRSQRRGGRKAPSSDGRSSHPGRRKAVLNKRAKCHWGRSSPTPFLPNGVNENRPHCHDPGFSDDNNYLKNTVAEEAHLDFFGELPEEKVILTDGTDVTETVKKAESWLIEHSF